MRGGSQTVVGNVGSLDKNFVVRAMGESRASIYEFVLLPLHHHLSAHRLCFRARIDTIIVSTRLTQSPSNSHLTLIRSLYRKQFAKDSSQLTNKYS